MFSSFVWHTRLYGPFIYVYAIFHILVCVFFIHPCIALLMAWSRTWYFILFQDVGGEFLFGVIYARHAIFWIACLFSQIQYYSWIMFIINVFTIYISLIYYIFRPFSFVFFQLNVWNIRKHQLFNFLLFPVTNRFVFQSQSGVRSC